MQYEVLPVRAEAPDAIADSIAAAYEDVGRRCGRVVAGYALTCESSSGDQGDPVRPVPEHLFLVAEFPDRDPSRSRRVAIGRAGGKASRPEVGNR